jgi:glycyl-tRNA synthetase beta chain
VGGFAAGLKPTGNKDPFAVRRNALGLARTLLEGGHELSVSELVTRALEAQPIKAQSEQAQDFSMFEICEEFIYERLRSYYSDQDIPVVQFEAVNNVAHGSLPDFDRRLKAIGEFAKLPEAEALAAANKRIRNILRKVEGAIPTRIDPALFTEAAERELFDAVEQAITDTDEALKSRDYVAALGRLAHLRPQVVAFFDAVMVNVDDVMVRNNRLALLARLDRMGTQVADISVLQSA